MHDLLQQLLIVEMDSHLLEYFFPQFQQPVNSNNVTLQRNIMDLKLK